MDKRDTLKCVIFKAMVGEKENPMEKADSSKPNTRDLHCLGMTSLREDSAIEIQLMTPEDADAI